MARALARTFVVCLLAPLLVLAACSRDNSAYSQATPEATIATARLMIENGDARLVPNLVYADTPDMRRLLNTVGRTFGRLEELATEVQTRYPTEVAELQRKAEEAARDGRATSLIGTLAQGARQQNRARRQGPPPPSERDAFNDSITRIFADPFATLRESEGKLTTLPLTDDSVALLWEGKPVLAPLGMVMKRAEDGRWYFVLPTNIPGASRFLPQTPEQYQAFGYIIAALDKVVLDLTAEVRSGSLRDLRAVSRRAGEMSFIPAVLAFYAYSQLRESQEEAGGT